jgi:hypothetical protein
MLAEAVELLAGASSQRLCDLATVHREAGVA